MMHTIETYLHQGWTINEAAQMLAHGTNNEASGYILTLSDPTGHFMRETYVLRSADMDDLLKRELVPMAA
jgi:hypothetical protein